MLLNEIFDRPLPYKLVSGGSGVDKFEFTTTSGILITVNVFKIRNFRQTGVDLSDSGIGFDFQNQSVDGDKEGITGTGDEFEVFATVLAIIEKSLVKHDPKLVAFGAHEDNRQDLYDKMIKVMQRKYAYELLDKPPVMFPLGTSKYYVLRKT